jgi:iron complex transport system ATP-binding protein
VSVALAVEGLNVTLDRERVLDGIELSVAKGEWLAVIGPNGAGKSTLLKALAGLVACTGEVRLDGVTTRQLGRREMARRLALVPQQPQVPGELTVAEYVLLGRTPHVGYFASEGRSDKLAAERAIARLGLRRFIARTLGSLSGGELQRVLLARALAQEAPVLLLDEPTSALDLGRQQFALELVDRVRREAALTVVSAMHDLTLAGQFADRMLLLDSGRVAVQGPVAEVLTAETVHAYYDASVHVIRENGNVFVLPYRGERRCLH